ncbi:hypothetical protein [Nocardia sp. NPDC057440]|uniref:hypothetical protein n=1 Tax=Nocardia sp. NPDC057440 TaxID=3346134 RepID=UPI003671D765
MTVISEHIENIAGADNTTAFLFGANLRESADGTTFITDRWQRYTATGGVLTTANLDPGPALVRIGGETRQIDIPDSGTAVRLWPLWEAAAPPPPITTNYVVNGGGIARVQKITVSAYAALVTPDPLTEYSLIPD